MAERLPIRLVPKQILIPAMRDNVIHICSRCHSPLVLAYNAERVIQQKSLSGLLPLVAVATLGARLSALVVLPLALVCEVFMALTEALASDQRTAGGSRTWLQWSLRH